MMTNYKIRESNFDSIFEDLLVNCSEENENGLKYGLTKEMIVGKFDGELNDLPLNIAKDIYKDSIWNPLNLDLIFNRKIARTIFEFVLLTGEMDESILILKRSFNILNIKYTINESPNITDKQAKTINEYRFYKLLYTVYVSKCCQYFENMINTCNEDEVSFNKNLYRRWLRSK